MNKETFITFEKAAKLALPENERESLLKTVNELLLRFDTLSAVDTTNAAPLVSVLESQKNVLRADESKKLISRDELLNYAPEADEGCFVVPKTID